MFRYNERSNDSYNRQGYVYFVCHAFPSLPKEQRETIRSLCKAAGAEHERALFRYMTSDVPLDVLCRENHVSRATLFRCVRRFYRLFPESL